MKIPFLSFNREIDELLKLGLMGDIENTIKTGKFLFGTKAIELETKLSEMFERPVVLVGSGTDALVLSLRALGIGYGDYVAVPSISAIPTAVAVKTVGANPVYVDVDSSFTMDCACLEQIILRNHDLKAVIPVHLYGNPALIGKIRTICEQYKLALIEDCAQSFGASGLTSKLGTFGMAGALSFYPSKNLGAMGDAGGVVACDDLLAQAIRELRFYGQKSNYKMGKFVGINSRVDEIQCTILLKKMYLLPAQFERRLEMKQIYDNVISQTRFWTPSWRNGAMPHLYPIVSEDRNNVTKILLDKGIETIIHYPFHLMEEVEGLPGVGNLSRAKMFTEKVFSLPFNPWMTNDEINYVLQSVKEIGG